MTDVSGIPNMGFGGGGYFGGNAATGQPAMSAAQINASMGWNPNAAQFNPFANSGGSFGAMPAYYAALGAAYGRQVAPSSPAAVAAARPNVWSTGAPAYNAYGGGANPGGFSPSPNYPGGGQTDRLRSLYPMAFSGGGIGSDAVAARAAAVTPQPRLPQPQDWQSTFSNMVHGSGGNPYALGGSPWYPASAYSGGGIGSDARFGGQNTVSGYGAALDRLRAGQGWTIAQQPPAASQGTLTSRINQGIYDIGNAGNAYNRMIGGGFGMNFPNTGQSLTPQDLAIPHAYPPEVRNPGPQSNLNWYGQPPVSS